MTADQVNKVASLTPGKSRNIKLQKGKQGTLDLESDNSAVVLNCTVN